MKIYIATKNENKIAVVRELVVELLTPKAEVFGCDAKSDVSDTPWDDQTYLGAKNRASNSLLENSSADLGIGVETGLTQRFGQLFEETWCCIVDQNQHNIPNSVQHRVVENEKAGTKTLEVLDSNTRQWSSYSGNPKIRGVCLSCAIRTALTQFTQKAKK
jgi:non-canonical (house-cleaning) NTP pyrophosphatase